MAPPLSPSPFQGELFKEAAPRLFQSTAVAVMKDWKYGGVSRAEILLISPNY